MPTKTNVKLYLSGHVTRSVLNSICYKKRRKYGVPPPTDGSFKTTCRVPHHHLDKNISLTCLGGQTSRELVENRFTSTGVTREPTWSRPHWV